MKVRIGKQIDVTESSDNRDIFSQLFVPRVARQTRRKRQEDRESNERQNHIEKSSAAANELETELKQLSRMAQRILPKVQQLVAMNRTARNLDVDRLFDLRQLSRINDVLYSVINHGRTPIVRNER